ncbi:hypothetical protein AMS68_001552 [Peltaster fructicola]|uniref:Uncharacterized protein n=1 Tax=Peltaster fructicola TaxID=286661 RepID=A0A6H0XN22_9PEZI|nr:hypothetical protein AMS68_001552 [Peltaster fructicola]
MTFTIEPLLHDDLDRFIQTWWDSFEPEAADQVLPMIYPCGLTPELKTRLTQRVMNETDGDTVEYCFCARDDESKQIVGVSWWKKLAKPSPSRSEEESKADLEAQIQRKNAGPAIAGMNVELGDAFYRSLYDAERRTIQAKQVPYIGLTVLGVRPEFARQGAGSLLLEHGLKRVDKLSVPVWLVASSYGRGLYLKHDFEVLEEFDFDGTKHGGRSKGRHCIMLRPAQSS